MQALLWLGVGATLQLRCAKASHIAAASLAVGAGSRSTGAVAAHAGSIVAAHRLSCSWSAEPSWTRDRTHVPFTGRPGFSPLDHQESPPVTISSQSTKEVQAGGHSSLFGWMAGKKPDPLTKRAPGSQTPAEERLSERKPLCQRRLQHTPCWVPAFLVDCFFGKMNFGQNTPSSPSLSPHG